MKQKQTQVTNLKFRHELKYIITEEEMKILQNRLSPIMAYDKYAGDNGYSIRSLYFDDRDYSAYSDKLAGVEMRKKYRIRIYNYESRQIKLECKRKEGNYINKIAASLSVEEYEKIMSKDYGFLLQRPEKICQDFYLEVTLNGMKPVVFVDYERVPYVYEYGDVRVTFDQHVRGGLFGGDLFDATIPVFECLEPGRLIMEVKYTEFYPTLIKSLVQPAASIYTAASKYVMCLEKKNEYSGGVF